MVCGGSVILFWLTSTVVLGYRTNHIESGYSLIKLKCFIEYPTYKMEHALQYHYESFHAIYNDVLTNTENSVDRLKEIVQETM